LKFGAVLFIVYIPTQQVINFQLLGGIWILQTLPAVFLGLYTNWFNRWALLIGWLVAEVIGTTLFFVAGLKTLYAISLFGISLPTMYIAFSMVVLNLILAIILTPIFNVTGMRRGKDLTLPADYEEEETLPVEAGKEALG
jgi:SSS family solute:Na+ symporter